MMDPFDGRHRRDQRSPIAGGLAVFERRLASPPRSLVEAVAWHDDAWRLKEAVRIERRSLRWSNRATAAWLSIAREIGRMLRSMPKQSGARTPGFLRETPRLRDLGLSKKRSHQFQLLAQIPEEDFRGYLLDRIERGLPISLAEALCIAKGFTGSGRFNCREPRLAGVPMIGVPADLLWDVADAAYGAAADIEEGTHPANALAAALDAIMERVGAFVGRRREWEERRRIIERAVDVAAARPTTEATRTAKVGTT